MDLQHAINILKPTLTGHAVTDVEKTNDHAMLTLDDGRVVTLSVDSRHGEVVGCMSSPAIIDDVMLVSAPRIRLTIGTTAYDADRSPVMHTVQVMAAGMSLPLATIATIDHRLFDLSVS